MESLSRPDFDKIGMLLLLAIVAWGATASILMYWRATQHRRALARKKTERMFANGSTQW